MHYVETVKIDHFIKDLWFYCINLHILSGMNKKKLFFNIIISIFLQFVLWLYWRIEIRLHHNCLNSTATIPQKHKYLTNLMDKYTSAMSFFYLILFLLNRIIFVKYKLNQMNWFMITEWTEASNGGDICNINFRPHKTLKISK